MTIEETELYLLRAMARLVYQYSKDKMNVDKLEAMKLANKWHKLYGKYILKELKMMGDLMETLAKAEPKKRH